MLNFLKLFRKKIIRKQSVPDDVSRFIYEFKKHQAHQKLKAWQQVNLQ